MGCFSRELQIVQSVEVIPQIYQGMIQHTTQYGRKPESTLTKPVDGIASGFVIVRKAVERHCPNIVGHYQRSSRVLKLETHVEVLQRSLPW